MEYETQDLNIIEDDLDEAEDDIRDYSVYQKFIRSEVRYDSADYISVPRRVEGGSVPIDILQFHHSFGYDCKKYYNLCVADPNTLIFASGNLLHFLDAIDGTIWFRRGSTGGGIGHICKNPQFNHIAIGENGNDPPIIIYTWPTMEIIRLLLEGTTKSYSHLTYSPDGLLLLSQGGLPDYSITIWNWRESKIILRCKSYGQDVYNAVFSTYMPEYLATCGSGHVKFWKMIQTFTGLKLKGQLGLFGKTEISEVLGIYHTPDGKVVTGCEWGNILLWEEGTIKVEIRSKNDEPCHAAAITQFEYANGDLVSVGMDGLIRSWFYETIDQADPPDDNRFLEILPIYEFHITEHDVDSNKPSSKLMGIHKRYPDNYADTSWYAQDGNGGIWLIDINTLEKPLPPQKIFHCHAGRIMDMDVADWAPFVATIGEDGRLHIYNYQEKRLILVHYFCDGGCQVIWFPCKVEPTGSTLCCAFKSGVVRCINVSVLTANATTDINGDYVKLIKVLKPHKSTITRMTLNASYDLLVTGSTDETVFVFSVHYSEAHLNISPIGFVQVPSGVTCLTWKPNSETTLLVGCLYGECMEFELPRIGKPEPIITYKIPPKNSRSFKFCSVKSYIRRELAELELKKIQEAKLAEVRQQIEKMKRDNPDLEVDENIFLDTEELPLPEIYTPPIPNKVLAVRYTDYGTVWLLMAGYDAGYVYEYPAPSSGTLIPEKPIRSVLVNDADDVEIHSFLVCEERKFIFLGMEHGEIRVCRMKSDQMDLSDYWILPMHDNHNGCISKLSFTYDKKMLLSCGYDGNLFSYEIRSDEDLVFDIPKAELPAEMIETSVEDIEEPNNYPTLEETVVKAERDRLNHVAKENQMKMLSFLYDLTEKNRKILDRNFNLLKSQQIPRNQFCLDARIATDLNIHLETEINLVHEKMLYKVERAKLGWQKLYRYFVEPITSLPVAVHKILSPDSTVYSLRERKFDITQRTVKCVKDKGTTDRVQEEYAGEEETKEEEEEEEATDTQMQDLERFLTSPTFPSTQYILRVQVNKLLRRYNEEKIRQQRKIKERKILHLDKPDVNGENSRYLSKIDEKSRAIGDFKLKSKLKLDFVFDETYSASFKFKKMLHCRKKLHELRENFNEELMSVRKRKEILQSKYRKLKERLDKIHREIPAKSALMLPAITITNVNEYPEENLEFAEYKSITDKAQEMKWTRQSIVVDTLWNAIDAESEALLLDKKTVRLDDDVQTNISQVHANIDRRGTIRTNDRNEKAWQHEMRENRLNRKLFEQNCILRYMQSDIEDLDKYIDKLENDRLEVVIECIYLELFLLTLRQEFDILEASEIIENNLKEKVATGTHARNASTENIRKLSGKIEKKNQEIAKLNEKIKQDYSEYMNMIRDDKFHSFLYKIFKKKYKPQHEKKEASTIESPTTSETSSLEDSDSTGDDASTDSKGLMALRFDESICPPGCSKDLYNTAFLMRDKRYSYEHSIREGQKTIEALQKQLDNESKLLKILKKNLNTCKDELTAFMLEKLRKVNEIDVTVLLKLQQLKHFDSEGKLCEMQNTVILDEMNLKYLYNRVKELELEEIDQRNKRKKCLKHLHRLENDCKFMKNEIQDVYKEIRQEIGQKLGQKSSVVELYQHVLRRIIYNANKSSFERRAVIEEKIKRIDEKYNEQMNNLQKLTRCNTEKLCVMSILESERLRLRDTPERSTLYKEDFMRMQSRYMADLNKLGKVLRNQAEQKQLLQNDIYNLQLKSRVGQFQSDH